MVAVRTAADFVILNCTREWRCANAGVRLYKSQSIKTRAADAESRLRCFPL